VQSPDRPLFGDHRIGFPWMPEPAVGLGQIERDLRVARRKRPRTLEFTDGRVLVAYAHGRKAAVQVRIDPEPGERTEIAFRL